MSARNYIGGIVGAIIASAGCYAIGAFIMWDRDPGHWDIGMRAMIAFIGAGVVILGAANGAALAEDAA